MAVQKNNYIYLSTKPCSNSRPCICLNAFPHPITAVCRTLGFPSLRAASSTGPACSSSSGGREHSVDTAKHLTTGFGSLQSCSIVLAAKRTASG